MISLPPKFPSAQLPESDLYKLQWYYRKYVEEYFSEYSFGHFILAAYAAVPSLLTPDLLYKIWQNFNGYKWGGEAASIHRVAVSDILLSPLCNEIGFELYEMHYDIRLALLEWLKTESGNPLWIKRELRTIDQVALFVEQYYHIPNAAGQRWGPNYIELQSLEAISYTRPGEAADMIFQKIKKAAAKASEPELLQSLDTFIKTKKRLDVLDDKNGPVYKLFNRQSELMEVWKTFIQKNSESFKDKLNSNTELLQLLTDTNDGGIELKVSGGIVEELGLAPDRKLRGLIAGVGERGKAVGVDAHEKNAMLFYNAIEGSLPDTQRDIKLLTGHEATKAAILDTWNEMVKNAAENDDLVFYFSANAIARDRHCQAWCAGITGNEDEASLFLRDEEIGAITKNARCASVTFILELDNAATPYWLDTSKPGNIVFASSRYDDEPVIYVNEDLGMFTYHLAASIKKHGSKLSNRNLFAEAALSYSNDPNGNTRLKTAQLLCNAEALNLFFLAGNNTTAALQDLLRQTGYCDEKTTGQWNTFTAYALDLYCKENGVQKNLSKQEYISSLLTYKQNSSAGDLPIFLLLFSDPQDKLPAIREERKTILQTLHGIDAQAEMVILDDPSKADVERIFRDKRNRNRIALFYYSGKDDKGYMVLKDGIFGLGDMAPLLDFQENIKLFFPNTCRSQFFASMMSQFGVAYTIGAIGEIDDAAAAGFGKSLFRLILDKKDIELNMDLHGTGISKSNAGFTPYSLYKAAWLTPDSKLIWDFDAIAATTELFSVIIAFDDYSALGNISSAVNNAMLFSEWINTQTKPYNCSRVINEGSQLNIDAALDNAFSQARSSVSKDKKLIIYMSGRGIKHPVNPVFCLPGMSESLRNNGLDLQSYFSTISGLGVFDNVILFYDLYETAFPAVTGISPMFGSPLPLKTADGLSMGYFYSPEKAYEPNITTQKEYGSFTKKLLEGLNGAARNNKGNITARSISDFVRNSDRSVTSTITGSTDIIIVKGKELIFQKVIIQFGSGHLKSNFNLMDKDLNKIDSVLIEQSFIEFELKPGLYIAEIPGSRTKKTFAVTASPVPITIDMSWHFLDKWICVIGSGDDLTEEETLTARAIGKFLADEGYGLVSGGWPGVDHVAGESYYTAVILYNEEKVNDYFVQYVETDRTAEYKKGTIINVTTKQWGDEVMKKCFACISIGGKGFTYEMFERTQKTNYPFIPLPHTGSDSRKIYRKLSAAPQPPIPADLIAQLAEIKTTDERCIDLLKKILDAIAVKPTSKGQIFISYSRYNAKEAAKIADDLKKNGHEIFMDINRLKAGMLFEGQMEAAIVDTAYVLVIVSPGSVASKHVAIEIAIAIKEKKKIIPLIIADCEMPIQLKNLAAIDISKNYETGFKQLLELLNATDQQGWDTQQKVPNDLAGTGNFYSEQDIKNLVGRSDTVLHTLLLFETSTQHTWLVFTPHTTYVLLDDEKTRKKNSLVQTSFDKSKTLPIKCRDSNKSKGAKVVRFAAQDTWWYYSGKIFPTHESLSMAIKQLLDIPPMP